jgi:glycosyltransferase involved in cell wall biosynthesis
MRILWICGSRIVGGAERATLQVAALLQARGHLFDALIPPVSALDPLLDRAGIAFKRDYIGGSLNLRAPLAIKRALKKAAPDLALVTTSDEWVWASLAKDSRGQTRFAFVRHMALTLPRSVRWLAGRNADAIVAVSNAVSDSLLVDALIPRNLVHVIHNPVRFTPRANPPTAQERAEARATLGLDSHGPWLGFFGGLGERKGIEDVVKSAALIKGDHPNLRLFACGRALESEKQSIGGWSRQLGGGFAYLGDIDSVELAMAAADVVVVATHSSLREAFPLTPLEALACGTPVVAYDTGGIPEVIGSNGETGLLVDRDDPSQLAAGIDQLLSDQVLANRIARGGLRRARELFSPELAAERYERLFCELIR